MGIWGPHLPTSRLRIDKSMKLWVTISLPLYLLDQLTKWLVLRNISTEEVIPVIPGFFNLVQVHNTGAAFSSGVFSGTWFQADVGDQMIVEFQDDPTKELRGTVITLGASADCTVAIALPA